MRTLATVNFAPGPNTVNHALAWLEGVAHDQEWPTQLSFQLNLCLDEALTNVLTHAFKAPELIEGEPEIRLTVQGDDQHIVVELQDNGPPFDPTAQASPPLAPTLDDASFGGHGLRLMRHYLEALRYEYRDGSNHLQLVARRPDSER